MRAGHRPRLPRFLARHIALGGLVALVFVGGLLATDPGGLSRLLMRDGDWPVAILLLWGFSALTFGSVAAVLQLGQLDEVAERAQAPVRQRRH